MIILKFMNKDHYKSLKVFKINNLELKHHKQQIIIIKELNIVIQLVKEIIVHTRLKIKLIKLL